ncbi:MAG: hypothetical protein JJT82_06020 [Legionellaceae bacterium]|nr:hypothetical protein [Legionellaceae bacterium]
MKPYYVVLGCCWLSPLYAERLAFKAEPTTRAFGLPLGICLLALLAVYGYWRQKKPKKGSTGEALQLIEHFTLGPGTKAWILSHQQQEWLIVDNRQHIAIQRLSGETHPQHPESTS